MKLTWFLVLIFTLPMSASVWSQTMSVKLENATLQELFRQIEKSSNYRFFYNNDEVDVSQRVTVFAEGKAVAKILTAAFERMPYSFKELDNKLILIERTNAPSKGIASGSQQQKTIIGKVTDSSGGSLPGVSIVIKGTTTGTITDSDGNYSISNVPENANLQFSFVGMKGQEIAVGNQTGINVNMVEDAIGIDEVVAIGYGTQKKVNLTGAVTSVNSSFIESRPLTNTTQALQGLNGVYINQAGGQPGADDATIRIRGIGTLNNNNPLVLVDGVEYSLNDINPNDVESISVLKDAASASIYGNRAANGVILVTTKTGKREKLKVELNSYYGWQNATYLPDMVTNSVDYMTARNQAAINEGQPVAYTDAQIEEYRTGTDPAKYSNTDWYGAMFSVAPMQNHDLRLSGGSENVTYSMSLGYLDQQGVLLATDAKHYSLNANIVFKKSEKLEMGTSINASFWDRNEFCEGSGRIMEYISRSLPIQPNVSYDDGTYADTWLTTPGHNIFKHPVVFATESSRNDKTQRALINIFGQYIFPLDIKYKLNFAVSKYDANQHIFVPEIKIINPKTNVARPFGSQSRSASQANNNNMNTSFFQTLNWTKKIAQQHDLNLLLGFSMESFYNSNFDAYVEGFLGNELTELDAGTINKDLGGTSTESKLMSYFGRANYMFSNRYLFEFNFRYDGSSRFAKANRWGFFPSVSVGWKLSEEPFMKSIEALNNLKVRASWGQLGNQSISLYSYLNNININQGTTFNNSIVGGSAVTALSDPNITWETTTISNIGLDLGLWDNKLELNIDIFNKKTTDILARINIPGQVGDLSGPITNLYGMSNKGIEIAGSHRNTIGKVNFRLGASVAFVDNNVDFLNGDVQYSTNAYGNISVIQEGSPVDSWFLYEAIGIFQTSDEVLNSPFQHIKTAPGDIKFRDLNNDDVIDINDMRVSGKSIPDFTYSFNLNVDYKGFDLGAFFQGVQGIDIYPMSNVSWPLFNGAGITKDQLANSWTTETPDAKYPRLSLYKRGSQINAKNSTFWLKDASYLRLKNLQLGYTLPSDLINKINVSKIRIYVNAQNYLTFSKYKVTDPEKNIGQQNIYEYPTTKILTTGINVTF